MTSAIAIFLALLSLLLILYFVRLFLGASFGDLRSVVEKLKFKKAASALTEVENLLAKGELTDAISKIKGVFYLDTSLNSPGLIDVVVTHNLSALSSLISISQKRSLRLDGIPLIEEMFQTRGELLRNLYNTKSSLRKASAGKSSTTWAADELKSKSQDIIRALATNRSSLEKELQKIFQLFEKSSDSSVTLH